MMAVLFDASGNATETHVATVYGFDPVTGEYQSAYNVRVLAGTGVPGFSTLTPPQARKAGAAVVFASGKWGYVEDNRGTTVYSTDTGAPATVNYLGSIAAGFVTVPPSSRFDYWNGKKWVTDTEARHLDEVSQANTQRDQLLTQADDVMRDWRDELALGTISDEDRQKLSAWLEYKKQLKSLDTTQSPPLVWPEQPEA